MAEHSAVNRRVVGSSPTCGANILEKAAFLRPSLFGGPELFCVYILENSHGKFYVRQSSNLEKRLEDHNLTDSFDGHFTRKNGPWKLIWTEAHNSRSSAMQRERQIKRMKSVRWIREQLLANAVNPDESG